MSDWSKFEQAISDAFGRSFLLKQNAAVSGGDINQAFRVEGVFTDNNQAAQYFIKLNQQSRLAMFEAEAAGLEEIDQSKTIRVPKVVCHGVEGSQSFLVLENLSLAQGLGVDAAKRLGQQLAAMHRVTAPQFGWQRNNTIGTTQQNNNLTDSWIDFWREQRLGFQLDLAKSHGCGLSLYTKGEKLKSQLQQFFLSYTPEPSLLHGDLWSGNYGYLSSGEPVIYDPAVYYGDRETDLAMTELFGGFVAEFYSAYNEVWPLDKGYQRRKTLYNLYHVLNHFNLFGGGYAIQAENMLDNLLDGI